MMQTSPSSEARPTPRNSTSAPPLTVRPLIVESYGLTDRGLMRVTNEDQFMTATLRRALCVEQSSRSRSAVRYADDRSHVFIVADGVGGVAGGEKASALAVGAVEEFLLNALRWLLGLDGSAYTSVVRELKGGMLTDERIATTIATMQSPRQACEELVRSANEEGGKDNVTVVIARYL
jgi:serine/threonine protein phosphatase PrpC